MEGNRHRESGPAIIAYHDLNTEPIALADVLNDEPYFPATEQSPLKEWWLNGQRHREDGPAIERPDGGLQFWVDGGLHREGGPAVITASGKREWWLRHYLHRLDGPALEWDRTVLDRSPMAGLEVEDEWWVDGQKVVGGLRATADRMYRSATLTDEDAFEALTQYPTVLVATLIRQNPSACLTDRVRRFAALLV